MKRIILSALVVVFFSSLCFADQAPAPVAQAAKVSKVPAAEVKSVTGKVDSVTIGDASKGVKSEFVVVNDNGQKLSFIAKSGISVAGKDGKAVALVNVKKGDKVAVDYVVKASGINKAQSIRILG